MDAAGGKLTKTFLLTRAPTGVRANFAPTKGADDRSPGISKKLSNVARSGKRHSKAWEKVYRKYFGHFFAKVKHDNTGGHQNSNFTIISLRPTIFDKRRRSS